MPQTPFGERKLATPATRLKDTTAESPVRQDGPGPDIFWASLTMEELARAQNVRPMTEVQALFGTWPGDEDDGFEAAVDELRYPVGANSCPVDRQMRKSYGS